MLLLYYNPSYNCIYAKYVHSCHFEKSVGYENQFGHIIVQILYNTGTHFVNANDFWDYVEISKSQETSFKNKVINRTIDLLNKMKKE